MTINFAVPDGLEQRLRHEVPTLDTDAREAVALDLFRNEKITLYELRQILGLTRSQVNHLLIARREWAQSPTIDDLERDYHANDPLSEPDQ